MIAPAATPLQIKPTHLILLVFVMVVWGANLAIAKLVLPQIPPLLMMALRFGIVALVLVPFVPRPTGDWRNVFLVSVTLGFLHFSLMFSGLAGIDAATAAITVQLQVPFASLLAAIFFGDKLGWRRGLGMAIAFIGVAVIAGEPRLNGNYGALALTVAGSLVWAVSNTQVKALHRQSGWTISAWMSLFAVPQLLLASALLEEGQMTALATADWIAWGGVLYNALAVMVLGYGIWYWMLRRYDVNQTMPITLLVPVFGVLAAVIILGETLSLTFLLGGLLTVLGVATIILRRPTTADPNAERI